MKPLRVIFQKAALKDLEEIWLYTLETWSLEQADRYHGFIFNEVEFLSKKPESGKDLSYLREGYRSSKIKSHIIFCKYSLVEIEIIRILHENMGIPNRLDD